MLARSGIRQLRSAVSIRLVRPLFFRPRLHLNLQQQQPPGARAVAMAAAGGSGASKKSLELQVVDVHNPNELNFILGHSHFIQTVEDLYETLARASPALKFGIAFCEASGDRKVRTDGNDDSLVELAAQNALAIGAGHSFIIFLDGGFPISVLNAIKAVPEVCRIHCATANPVSVIIAKTSEEAKGVLGVIDGLVPTEVEDEEDKKKRHDFLRMIGYKR